MNRWRSRCLPGLLGLLLILSPGPLLAAELQPAPGLLMVAREGLPDPRFHDSVVLLLQHDPRGSVGLIINRPSRLPLTEVLADHAGLLGDRALSYGGPVGSQGLMALVHAAEMPPHPALAVLDDLYITGVEELLEWLPGQDAPVEFRIFLGYAGWAGGQLTAELERGDWQLLPAESTELLMVPEAGMWQRLKTLRLM